MRTIKGLGLYVVVLLFIFALLASCSESSSDGKESTVDSSSPISTTEEQSSESDSVSIKESEPDTYIEDNTETEFESETELESETECDTEEETHEVRLYSLMSNSGDQMNSFVIRTKHGKLIVLDGGVEGASLNADAYMPAALRAIADTDQTGYVEVEAWILSHAHNDHFGELRKTLDKYATDENFVIKQFIFDFPNYETDEYPCANNDADYLEQLKKSFNQYAELRGIPVADGSTYYDDLNGAYVNADRIAEGCEMEIDGIRIEFLQTWSKSDGTVINDNSLVMRVWVEGQSILFLQDTCTTKGYTLLGTYGEALKSDIVQMAHHGQGGVRKDVYDMINAKVHIWSTPLWVWNDSDTYEIDENRMWVNGGKDFITANDWNIVTCLYPAYPSSRVRVSEWKKVIDAMSIPLPYPAVATAPVPEKPSEPETETESSPGDAITYDAEYLIYNKGTIANVSSVALSDDGKDVIYTLEKSSEIYYNELASVIATHPYMVIKYKADYTCEARVQLRSKGGSFQATYFENPIVDTGLSTDDEYGYIIADFTSFVEENAPLDQIARFDFTRSGNTDGGILHIQALCLYISKEAYEATLSSTVE